MSLQDLLPLRPNHRKTLADEWRDILHGLLLVTDHHNHGRQILVNPNVYANVLIITFPLTVDQTGLMNIQKRSSKRFKQYTI